MLQGRGESQQQIDGIKIQSPATIPIPNKNTVQPTQVKLKELMPKYLRDHGLQKSAQMVNIKQTGLTFNLARYHDGSPPT